MCLQGSGSWQMFYSLPPIAGCACMNCVCRVLYIPRHHFSFLAAVNKLISRDTLCNNERMLYKAEEGHPQHFQWTVYFFQYMCYVQWDYFLTRVSLKCCRFQQLNTNMFIKISYLRLQVGCLKCITGSRVHYNMGTLQVLHIFMGVK